jgi:DNA-directed RNA polymerase specialized sigma24 family protein
VVDAGTATASFVEFVRDVEPRLRHALCAAFGLDLGREASAHALAYGWENWDEVRAKSNPAGYLWGVGRNYALKQTRRPPSLPPAPIQSMPWIEPGLPDALSALSERQRVTVILVHGLGWSQGEVAELMGISKSSVQTQVERGMTKLRKRMGVERVS